MVWWYYYCKGAGCSFTRSYNFFRKYGSVCNWIAFAIGRLEKRMPKSGPSQAWSFQILLPCMPWNDDQSWGTALAWREGVELRLWLECELSWCSQLPWCLRYAMTTINRSKLTDGHFHVKSRDWLMLCCDILQWGDRGTPSASHQAVIFNSVV